MSRPVELLIALRYLRGRQTSRFASFISAASMLGVAIGVAALITILSVMNGFESELKRRLLDVQAHAVITGEGGRVDDWPRVAATLEQDPRVQAAAPQVTIEGMANAAGQLVPVLAEGIVPEALEEELGDNIVVGSLDALEAGAGRIVLGRYLALDLGVAPGDDIVLLVPRNEAGDIRPTLTRFAVVALFESGVPDFDASVAYLHWRDAAELAGIGDAVNGIRLTLVDPFDAPTVAGDLAALAGAGAGATDWTRENASYFRAIRLEKAMMALILSLVIGVAAFNIVASLVMVVTDKETDIAILRTLGLSPSGVVRVFLTQGVVIGWLGVLIGVVGGVALALNVTETAAFIEGLLGFQVMPGDVYVMSRIPSEVRPANVVWIGAVALIVTGLATVYPARQAASVHPAQALRYG
ncbi:MAG: lipoprotein-releasing ABC transporter permease subunit [Pseudomonadota bacterium]